MSVEWFVVVDRLTMDYQHMPPYVVGPYSAQEASKELNSDCGLVYSLLTIDAKSERYIATECYMTPEPPEGERIIPEASL